MIDLEQIKRLHWTVLPPKAGDPPRIRVVRRNAAAQTVTLQFYLPRPVPGATFLGVYPCEASLPKARTRGLRTGDYAYVSETRQLIQLT